MMVSFLGVLLFRASLGNAEKRAVMTSVGSIISFVNVIIVYESVNWWKSLHQTQSTPRTVSETMHIPLRLAAFGMLFMVIGMIMIRGKTALQRIERETKAPDLPSNEDKKTIGGVTMIIAAVGDGVIKGAENMFMLPMDLTWLILLITHFPYYFEQEKIREWVRSSYE